MAQTFHPSMTPARPDGRLDSVSRADVHSATASEGAGRGVLLMGGSSCSRRCAARVLIGTLSLVLASSTASAQSSCPQRTQVDSLEDEGQTLRHGHRDAEALQRFEQAWNLCHEPRSMVRRGLAEWALGRWLDAEAHVVEGLSHQEDPWVRANRDAITREDLAEIRRHLGSLELVGSGGQGEVLVGGRRVASWPVSGPIRAVSGENVVLVQVPGHHPWRRTINVPAGGLAREQVELVTLSAPAPVEAPRSGHAATPTTSGAPIERGTDAPGRVDSTPSNTLRTLAWTGTALTLAAGAAAVATFVLYNDAVTEFGPTPLPATLSSSTRYCLSPTDSQQQSDCNAIASRRDTMGAIAVATGITAGALAIGTIVLWTQSGQRPPARAPGNARLEGCAPSLDHPGFQCSLTF